MSKEIALKILTLGESGVGKSCIILRYVESKFMNSHLSTIGIDYKSKNIVYKDKLVKLKIWDTAGQEKFRNITQQYFKNAEGIILVFDLTSEESFEKITDWIKQISDFLNLEEVSIILAGNKADLVKERAVEDDKIKELCQEYNFKYIEVSALSGQNIDELFYKLIDDLMDKKGLLKPQVEEVKKDNFDLNQNQNKKLNIKNRCCKP